MLTSAKMHLPFGCCGDKQLRNAIVAAIEAAPHMDAAPAALDHVDDCAANQGGICGCKPPAQDGTDLVALLAEMNGLFEMEGEDFRGNAIVAVARVVNKAIVALEAAQRRSELLQARIEREYTMVERIKAERDEAQKILRMLITDGEADIAKGALRHKAERDAAVALLREARNAGQYIRIGKPTLEKIDVFLSAIVGGDRG